ncbi:MAG: DUF2194 domain-containing protein [Butyrivibrio sp.]|nr:DUF2194 domain-containing protein [Butyrivibrio sp.]
MKKGRFSGLFRVIFGFFGIFLLLLFERVGILYGSNTSDSYVLSTDRITRVKESKKAKTCLVIIDSDNKSSANAYEQYEQILKDMRIQTRVWDLSLDKFEQDYFNEIKDDVETLIFCINDYSQFGESILSITNWVKQGGRALIGITPSKSREFEMISSKLGIVETGDSYARVDDFTSADGFMLGAQNTYVIEDAYESALSVQLDESCRIYAYAGDGKVPLIWSIGYGEGRFVFCNFGYMGKAYRGIYSSAYTLLEDICIYPVINASTFYIDDFPSPVPPGDGQYIKRDYGMGIADFYSSIWWPEMLALGSQHNVKYTGLIIENYNDTTSGELEANKSTADYYYYGNMLLNQGGELGYHGYNHQPLCGPDYVYQEDLGYKTWDSAETMEDSLKELIDFATGIYPAATLSVYVPPSDVLSAEGREILGYRIPEIKTIASIYFEGADAYAQEFTVSEDGIIETPRIVSSCNIDDFMKMASFSELNFHFITSHFMHPDDLLDEDRGAALGWEKLKENLNEYMDWIDISAPDIRHVTGSGMAGAVQRYVNTSHDYEVFDNSISFTCDGLIDSAYYMVRCNEGVITSSYGANITRINETLYLMHVKSGKVTLIRNKDKK